ncbi:MAG: ferrous iron transport protein B [bacterium]|nr:ferrous iron transport protein B [bacterium]
MAPATPQETGDGATANDVRDDTGAPLKSASTAHSTNAAAARLTIALVGNPNTGKSTLFSALCGTPARIGNYPGVTVEKKLGTYSDAHGSITVVDLPGTYSLAARTLDEKVSVDVLLDHQKQTSAIDVIVSIVDATNIERNLYLFSQLRDIGKPLVLVLNMWDRVEPQGMKIDAAGISERLGVPVVTCSASRRRGIPELKQAIRQAAMSAEQQTRAIFPTVLGEALDSEVRQLMQWTADASGTEVEPFVAQRLLMDVDGVLAKQLQLRPGMSGLGEQIAAARTRLEQAKLKVPTCETKLRYQWIRSQLSEFVSQSEGNRETWSDRIDHWLTHRVWGILAFAAIMFVVFQAITQGTAWAMDFITDSIQPWFAGWVEQVLPPGTLRSLVNDGIIAGVGSVIVFLPQILMLFFFIGLLEDCGYMARAAFVMDKSMTKLGLSGKSFLPLMSSFACAVPGIMATRVIESRRDRMVTILIAPLMSCSARLPVYVLLVTAFVPSIKYAGGWIGLQGIVLFAMHLVGAAVAIPVAWLLKKYFFPGATPPFVMELPSYKLPSPSVVLNRVWERGQAFLTRAGTLIFCSAIVVWAAGYFPGNHQPVNELTQRMEGIEASGGDPPAELQAERRKLSSQLIEQSYLGRAGKAIEPMVRPLGWDWRIGVGAIASFPAREVIIATLGTIYSLGGDVDEGDEGLLAAMKQSKWPDGRPVYNLAVALSIMVFFALCAQCAATLMVIKRETNSWRWPLFSFAYMTLLAYLGALLTYQVSIRLIS